MTGSCTSPRVNMSAMAWRTSSPTRNWRCEPPPGAVLSRCDFLRDIKNSTNSFVMAGFILAIHVLLRKKGGAFSKSRVRELDSQRALNRLHPVAFDHVALPHVL